MYISNETSRLCYHKEVITQGKYISKRVTTRTQCSVEAWCHEVLGRWPLGFFRVGVVCIEWNNDNNRKSVSKRVTKIKTKSKCVPTIKTIRKVISHSKKVTYL